MFQLTTPYRSMISSLLHLVSLRPRVYYTSWAPAGIFAGGGASPKKAPLKTKKPPPKKKN